MIEIDKPGSSPNAFVAGLDGKLDVIEALDESLSYYVANYERMPKFQSGQWDGKEHLFKRSWNGFYYFPFGLTKKVEQVLQVFGEKYTKSGFNTCDIPTPETVGVFHLRDYQIDALNALKRQPLMSGVLALPTAAGKTVTALAWCEQVRRVDGRVKNVLILVHRMELMKQWGEEIKEKTGCAATLIGGSKKVTGDGVYTVAMIQTLYREKQREPVGNWSMYGDITVFDECHTMPSKTAYSVGMSIKSIYRLGLSATPNRPDGADMKLWGVAGCIAKIIDVEGLVDSGYIAEPIFELMYPDPVSGLKPWSSWADVYKRGITANVQRNDMIVMKTEDLLKQGRQVYIHVNHIAHGRALAGRIPGAKFLCGSDDKKDREQIISDFKSGELTVLVSTLLKEGVSIDGISALIYAAGGKSDIATIQTIGRALRMDETFGNALIFDFVDNGHKFLTEHSEERIRIYREIYGELFPY